MKQIVRSGAICLTLMSTSLFAANGIQVGSINSVLKAIADQVVKAEQVLDKNGKPSIEQVSLALDANTDFSKGVFGAKAVAAVNSSRWAPGKKTSLIVGVQGVDNGKNLELTAGVTLGTDVAALSRHGVGLLLTEAKACSEESITSSSDLKEQKYRRDACKDMEAMTKAADTAAFLDLLQSIVQKRVDYIDARLPELLNETALEEVLKAERVAMVSIRDTLKNRANKQSVTISFNNIEITATTKVKSISLSISPDAVKLSASVDSEEGKQAYDSVKGDLEKLASALSQADGDPAKDAAKLELETGLTMLVRLAKEVILPEAP